MVTPGIRRAACWEDEHMTNMPPAGPQLPPMQQQPQYAPPVAPATPKGLAITALIVGIVAFLMGLLPVIGALLGIGAVVFGAIALAKKQPKGLALTGLILGAVGLLASIGMTLGLGAIGNELAKPIDKIEIEAPAEENNVAEEPATEPEPEAEAAPAKPETTERLTLDEGWVHEADEYGISTRVKGYVSNNSDKAITNYVQITFDTLDVQGANLGTCLANTNTIDANGKWKFEAFCLDDADEIAEVRFKEITGF